MGGISIGTVDIGYSKQGAEAYKQKIHQEAIVDVQTSLRKIDGITSALEAGWQGQAELNFVANLQSAISKTCAALDELDKQLTEEFKAIHNAMVTQDEEMVPLDEE